ncbi:hypothetical protein BSKO_07484 [Bryopsis sp. KO-2023]|nr:hypothetical protein BSKO_07484 [Bryopsis sp. KO-2023]
MSGVNGVEKLLQNNSEWAEKVSAHNPGFFPELAKGQTPEYLWIGCADSRVVTNFVTGTKPGDVFCHRNVGNLVLHTDMNCMSALEYSVLHLKVKHVIVCGHYGCGAVNASLTLPQKSSGVVNCWIAHIRDVRNAHAEQLKNMAPEEKLPFMCEANAIRQAFNVCTAPAIQAAWAGGQEVYVHALVFDLATGKLKRLAGPISSLQQAADAEAGHAKHTAGQISKDLADVLSFESTM